MKHLRFQPIPTLHVQQLPINLCLNLNPKLNLALKSTVCRQKINLSNVQQSILKTGCRAQVRIHRLMKNISDVTLCRETNAVNKVKNKIRRNQLAMKRVFVSSFLYQYLSVVFSTVFCLGIRLLEGTCYHSVVQNKYRK